MPERVTPAPGARVQIAVPVAQIDGALTYGVPKTMLETCVPGVRVRVSVGGRRLVGLVLADAPDEKLPSSRLKLIEAVLDDAPVVTPEQLKLARFVADYYIAPIGEAVRLVLPPDTERDLKRSYKLSELGKRSLVFGAAHGLTARDVEALATFEVGEHKTEAQLARAGVNRRRLTRLVEREFLEQAESRGTVRGKKEETLIVLDDGEELPARAPALAQLDTWLRDQPAAPTMQMAQMAFPGVRGKVRRLVELGRLRVLEEVRAQSVLSPLEDGGPVAELTPEQAVAVEAIAIADPEASRSFLLEGVTGSGKTEVYLRTLREVLARGQGALLIVTLVERRDALARLREGKARVALGARSALFAPVQDLGLIVVDEEHEPSLKQDETPRYHARDVALWRARAEHAICLLGSATPSLESRHNVETGKLTRLALTTRIGGGGKLPAVEIIDLRARGQIREATARDRSITDGPSQAILSAPLFDAMEETLVAGEQVLLFLNRRGYAAFLLCEECGEIRQCPFCSVSLTLHTGSANVVCHQCDYEEPVPQVCGECGASPLNALGLGTERVEAEVRARFPNARVARLDRDTARKKGEIERVLRAVQRREVDVLIGTQMVAKGHDFPGISLVGVVLADVALAVPDFRASERAFSLLTQVAGRAGRGERHGRVLVQTYNPTHPAIQAAQRHDVDTFVENELKIRREAKYPPYWRVAILRVEGLDPVVVDTIARRVGDRVRAAGQALLEAGTWDVLGPAPAPLERLRGNTRHQVFLRALSAASRGRVLATVAGDESLQRALDRSGCRLVLDVDPVHVL